jgi:hypothetical protein
MFSIHKGKNNQNYEVFLNKFHAKYDLDLEFHNFWWGGL